MPIGNPMVNRAFPGTSCDSRDSPNTGEGPTIGDREPLQTGSHSKHKFHDAPRKIFNREHNSVVRTQLIGAVLQQLLRRSTGAEKLKRRVAPKPIFKINVLLWVFRKTRSPKAEETPGFAPRGIHSGWALVLITHRNYRGKRSSKKASNSRQIGFGALYSLYSVCAKAIIQYIPKARRRLLTAGQGKCRENILRQRVHKCETVRTISQRKREHDVKEER